ncbi:DinB family protein [Kordia sp. YSTF-M3]|uniref:DinB family protein n=2 Tax=Kordia aestuariivivens TaxID=2759037 RepID=A0ABR7QCE1_9FLAO|nr:DinB family protein [Kordia aestuariivivens]
MKKFAITIVFFMFCSISVNAQTIEPAKGYDTQIGNIVSMLNDLKRRVTNSVRNLTREETDFLLDENANRIGAMIYHLAATEKYYQLYTFENRGFNKDEREWEAALNLGENGRKQFQNKPIQYYLDIWNDVRKETLRLLKTKTDNWFVSKVRNSNMNNHWAWYHVMEHQANHMGQIRLIIKRIDN